MLSQKWWKFPTIIKNWLKKTNSPWVEALSMKSQRARDSSEYRRHKKQKHWRDFTEGQN